MNTPLISVIVPVYNVAPYLREAIESVILQSYPHWELLLINDGSTDGSAEIAKEYASRYPEKARYLEHPGGVNKGLPASRNLAVRHATGEYVALLDADDYWLPEKLAFQVSIAQKYPQAAMICGASLHWYSWADDQKKDIPVPVGGPQDQEIIPPLPALALYPLGEGGAPCPCSIMAKREVVLRYKGFEEQFNGKYQFYEDQAFLMKIYLHERIYISSRVMDRYRQREDSIMSQYEQEYATIRHFYLKWLSEYLANEKKLYPAVRKKLKAALLPYERPFLYKIKRSLGIK